MTLTILGLADHHQTGNHVHYLYKLVSNINVAMVWLGLVVFGFFSCLVERPAVTGSFGLNDDMYAAPSSAFASSRQDNFALVKSHDITGSRNSSNA